jgi:hypothetical protein
MERLNRSAGIAALFVALLALVLAVTVPALAQRRKAKKPAPVVRLVRGKVPARFLPTVSRAKRADRLGGDGATAETLVGSCAPDTVDLGTWCLSSALTPLLDDEVGKNDYLFATQKCVELGGWLPTAGQLVGAAERVKLAGTIDDSRLTATIDLDPTDGSKDRREMSSTLITTAAGSSAAGSEGVTDGSKGDPKTGEPDPVTLPANPVPETLQYVTVYDNRDKGGFAGSKPVSQPESFRCAYAQIEGAAQREIG